MTTKRNYWFTIFQVIRKILAAMLVFGKQTDVDVHMCVRERIERGKGEKERGEKKWRKKSPTMMAAVIAPQQSHKQNADESAYTC